MQDLLNLVPEVIVVGDLEFLFIGAAAALGFPRLATRILESRYQTDLDGDGEIAAPDDETTDE